MIASWGGGFNPAVQALALELYARRHVKREDAETGKLFGALSVIQAMWYVFLLTGSLECFLGSNKCAPGTALRSLVPPSLGLRI